MALSQVSWARVVFARRFLTASLASGNPHNNSCSATPNERRFHIWTGDMWGAADYTCIGLHRLTFPLYCLQTPLSKPGGMEAVSGIQEYAVYKQQRPMVLRLECLHTCIQRLDLADYIMFFSRGSVRCSCLSEAGFNVLDWLFLSRLHGVDQSRFGGPEWVPLSSETTFRGFIDVFSYDVIVLVGGTFVFRE